MRLKTVAVTLAVTALSLGSVLITAPAHAEAECSVVDITPEVVNVGITAKTVQFDVGTDCEEDADVDWYLTGTDPRAGCCGFMWLANFPLPPNTRYTYDPDGKWTFRLTDNTLAGFANTLSTSAFVDLNEEGYDGEDLMSGSATLTFRRSTTFGSTFNASPEPRRVGQTINIKASLKRANWDKAKYEGVGAYVMLQFRPAGADEYTNVKWVWNDGVSASTKVKAVKTGTWRYHFYADSISGASNSKGDTVTVRP